MNLVHHVSRLWDLMQDQQIFDELTQLQSHA